MLWKRQKRKPTTASTEALKDKELREKVYGRDRWRCRVCKMGQQLHAHHIKFRSQGGANTTSNLITLCNRCHEEGVHQRLILIVARSGKLDDIVDADKGVKILLLPGWSPTTRE